MEKVFFTMNFTGLTRTGTAFVTAAVLFAAVPSGANAGGNTFNVSTTIDASCSVTDSGPGNLFPTYAPSTDTSVGAETVLNTDCNGTNPTVTFTDGVGATGGYYYMRDSNFDNLQYYLSNTATCTGLSGNMGEGDPQTITSAAFDICASVTPGQTSAPAGVYSDTVTYSISP